MEEPHAASADRVEKLLVTVLDLPVADREAALDALCMQHIELPEDLRARFALFRRLLDVAPQHSTPERFGEFKLVRELER